jgi:tetratricopeptide (TPR) repeat protein
MRRMGNLWIVALILICLPATALSQTRQGEPAGQVQPSGQSTDPLEGSWAGIVRSPQGGQMRAQVIITKQANGYAGSITDFQPGKPMIPFQVLTYDEKERKVAARFSFTPPRGSPTPVNVSFSVAGDSLLGNAIVRLDNNPPVQFIYELKKQADTGAAGVLEERPAEIEEYNGIKAERDVDAKIKLIDSFVKNHPDSPMRAYALQEGALLGKRMNDIEMMADYGERSLAAWPDNFVLMTELASGYVQRRLPDKAEEKATKAIELVEKADKPAQITEAQWASGKKNLLITNFGTLGFVHLNRAQSTKDMPQRKAECEKALAPFKLALDLMPSDDYSLYGMGVVYALMDDYPNAEPNLAKAIVISGQVSAISRALLEELYKGQHNGNLNGLDQVLAKAKTELGIIR